MKKIKNATAEVKIWVGQEVQPGQYYEIQSAELPQWQTNTTVGHDILHGYAVMNNGSDIVDPYHGLDYLRDIDQIQKDAENAPIQRIKMAPSGWTYKLRGVEFCTSNTTENFSMDHLGNNKNDFTVKFYDAQGVELLDQAAIDLSCVMTVVDIEPQHDYELIGGTAHLLDVPSGDCRLWVVAVPDIPEEFGGTKVMIDGVNFKYLKEGDSIHADGRVSKRMYYDPVNHTNLLRLILRHGVGVKYNFQFMLEFFKP